VAAPVVNDVPPWHDPQTTSFGPPVQDGTLFVPLAIVLPWQYKLHVFLVPDPVIGPVKLVPGPIDHDQFV
jgi:hypothetical protein